MDSGRSGGNNRSGLDLRRMGHVELDSPRSVVVTREAWGLLKTRCHEMNDDEFHVVHVYKYYIAFSLTDRDGKPQQYQIRARLLKRTKRTTGKKLFALFLIFEKDGHTVVDTAQNWFDPFKPWLKFWAGKGIRPKSAGM